MLNRFLMVLIPAFRSVKIYWCEKKAFVERWDSICADTLPASEKHLSQGIIQQDDDNADSKSKGKTRLDKNELTDCAAQFYPFECDVSFQDAKCTCYL